MKLPYTAVLDPETDNLQEWAEIPYNANRLHGAAVEAARLMSLDSQLEGVMVVKFTWEDEVHGDMTLRRENVAEAVQYAIDYYVDREEYEFAANAKNWLDRVNGLDK